MYQQFLFAHKNFFLSILWRCSKQETNKDYILHYVHVNCSPFVLALAKIFDDITLIIPIYLKLSEEPDLWMILPLKVMLLKKCFELLKRSSNHSSLMSDLPQTHLQRQPFSFDS